MRKPRGFSQGNLGLMTKGSTSTPMAAGFFFMKAPTIGAANSWLLALAGIPPKSA